MSMMEIASEHLKKFSEFRAACASINVQDAKTHVLLLGQGQGRSTFIKNIEAERPLYYQLNGYPVVRFNDVCIHMPENDSHYIGDLLSYELVIVMFRTKINDSVQRLIDLCDRSSISTMVIYNNEKKNAYNIEEVAVQAEHRYFVINVTDPIPADIFKHMLSFSDETSSVGLV